MALLASPAWAQEVYGPPTPGQGGVATGSIPRLTSILDAASGENPQDLEDAFNPLRMLEAAAALAPGGSGSGDSGPGGPGASGPSQGPGISPAVNILVLLTVLTVAPAIVLMTTCFVRIIIVLALLRQAMGTQSLPPPQVLTGLSLFMTMLVMAPTLDRVWNEAVVPYQQGEIRDYDALWDKAKRPVRDFMFDQIEATGNWSSLVMVLNYRGVDTSDPSKLTRADVDMVSLVPAFMLSELKTAFLMGFRIYLPFLVIDMVIAAILISMSMMMLPPVLISLPFKLLLFVLVDGWTLVVGGLLGSFVLEGQSARLSETATAWLGEAANWWPSVSSGLG
ncbi:MAG: flagellar type III secretion system pore protein FliP [Phycisphaeraceae bacterium]|nr:flagellar type III secretion system pore protein FliP [Phycisphaeraceae bacterium]